MQNKIRIYFILGLLFSIAAADAKTSDFQVNPLMPIEWQTIKLQENIESKIIRSLAPIIKESEYVIEVKIGANTDNLEDPTSKKISKTRESKKIKYSTDPAPKDGDDFIVFNKLGLEAQLVGDEAVDTETSEVELAQKAMIEMNDRFNLFNYLQSIDIKLSFDKGLTEKTKKSIKKIISGLSFNTKKVVPQIDIEYLDLRSSKVKSDEPHVPEALKGKEAEALKTNFLERFKNLDIMIGLVLAAIVLGVFALLIARLGAKSQVDQEAKNEEKNEEVRPEELVEPLPEELEELTNEVIEGEDMGFDATKQDALTMKINEGLERFRKISTLHHNEMILMLKGWIKSGKGDEALALRCLIEVLSDDELLVIFKHLSIDERSSWKLCLNGEQTTKEEIGKGFVFIGQSIIQMMMVPSLIDDFEICDLLLDLSAEDAAKFSQEHAELGVIFANVLSAKTLSAMFRNMPIRLAKDIIGKSVFFKKEEILAQMPLLKVKLLDIKANKQRPPFLKRILDILPTAYPEIEKELYGTLLQHMTLEEVREQTLKILPTELALSVNDNIYKECIALLPLETQVHYFISLGEELRVKNLNRFAAKGAKNREMLEIEINSVLKNELVARKIINERAEVLQNEFVLMVRNYVSEHVEVQREITFSVDEWLKKIKGESHKNEFAA